MRRHLLDGGPFRRFLPPQPVADIGGDAGVIAMANEQIGRGAAEELFQSPLGAGNGQVEEGFVESQPARLLIEADGRAEEQPVVGAARRLRAAEIDETQGNAPPDQPAGQTVQHDPQRAIGEGGAGRALIAQHDLRQAVGDQKIAMRIGDGDVQKAKRTG